MRVNRRLFGAGLAGLGLSQAASGSALAAPDPPGRIRVRPVFLVPTDAPMPARATADLLMRHLKWAQDRYRELLFGRDTFEIACSQPEYR
jgi:hypothetical protein